MSRKSILVILFLVAVILAAAVGMAKAQTPAAPAACVTAQPPG